MQITIVCKFDNMQLCLWIIEKLTNMCLCDLDFSSYTSYWMMQEYLFTD